MLSGSVVASQRFHLFGSRQRPRARTDSSSASHPSPLARHPQLNTGPATSSRNHDSTTFHRHSSPLLFTSQPTTSKTNLRKRNTLTKPSQSRPKFRLNRLTALPPPVTTIVSPSCHFVSRHSESLDALPRLCRRFFLPYKPRRLTEPLCFFIFSRKKSSDNHTQ